MTTNGMDSVDGFLGPRLGLRSSRVTSNAAYEDQDEKEQLIPSDDSFYRNEFKKSQGRSWKAKREDSDEDIYNYGKNENGSAIPLQRIRGKTQPTDSCVEAEIISGDTLAKVALRYNVPISELKRVNNLMNEAEFHALKTIKVPAKADSLLTELLPEASSGTLGRLGGEVRSGDGWYVKSSGSIPGRDLYLSDPTSSPLSVSASSSEIGVGELIQLHDDVESNQIHENSDKNCNSKQAKKVNRILKNVDKDLARIKERELSRSLSPEGKQLLNGVNDSNTVSLNLTSSSPTGTKQFLNSTSGQKPGVKVINSSSNNENSWCSRSGICCISSIILAVIVICLIAYHFDHSKFLVSKESDEHHSEKASNANN